MIYVKNEYSRSVESWQTEGEKDFEAISGLSSGTNIGLFAGPTPKTQHHTMGWQKTFTLRRRSKGCYLITDEIFVNVQDGLKGVQASKWLYVPWYQ
jgi:hypothetical protein